jgi:DNA-binding transcriptional MerR regulator
MIPDMKELRLAARFRSHSRETIRNVMTATNEETPLKIGQAASKLGLKSYVLRYWETEFSMLKPIRTESGQRLYGPEQMRMLEEIRSLLYEEGLTIEGARKRLESGEERDTLAEVRNELREIAKLLE